MSRPSSPKSATILTAVLTNLARQDDDGIHVELTYDPLDAVSAMARVKSPKAGAVVLFAGMLEIRFSFVGIFLSSVFRPSTRVGLHSFVQTAASLLFCFFDVVPNARRQFPARL